MVGNDRISSVRFPYLTIIEEKTDGTPWGGSGVLTENRVGADNLAWEKAKKSTSVWISTSSATASP